MFVFSLKLQEMGLTAGLGRSPLGKFAAISRPLAELRAETRMDDRRVPARYFEGPLFRRSAIPKVHCADTRHSANVWVKVKIKIRVRVIGLGSALGLGLGLVGIVDFRNSGPELDERRESKELKEGRKEAERRRCKIPRTLLVSRSVHPPRVGLSASRPMEQHSCTQQKVGRTFCRRIAHSLIVC